jgi:hypothetical protein
MKPLGLARILTIGRSVPADRDIQRPFGGGSPLRFTGSTVNHQKHGITRICTPDVDPTIEPADGLERRFTDVAAKRCRRYSGGNSQDELRGANRERTAVQVHTRAI